MERLFLSARYRELIAFPDRDSGLVELIEIPECMGGAYWVFYQLQRSDLVIRAQAGFGWFRYLLRCGESRIPESANYPAKISRVELERDKIWISYSGSGGARYLGMLRSSSPDVIHFDPRDNSLALRPRIKLLIGIDDTDTKHSGATWALGHWMGKRFNSQRWRYLSHTIVQLYPVRYRTQNCVACCLEFGCLDLELIPKFKQLLLSQSLSEHTGMVVFQGLDPSPLLRYGIECKRKQLTMEHALECMELGGAQVIIQARGSIGAGAAIPFCNDHLRACSSWS